MVEEPDLVKRERLLRQLLWIALERAAIPRVFTEVTESPMFPVLPDAYFRQTVPSERVRYGCSWDEGATKRRVRHIVE